jgi:predicted dehydrogenase
MDEKTNPVRWGVLGVAGIAVSKVIPGIQRSALSRVEAIASRSASRAEEAAARLSIPRWHGSYQDLLDDTAIEAVYIPLPNHLHAEWAMKAAAAGKHVLCEKPLAMSSAEAKEMVQVAEDAGVRLMEAFMYRLHPLWVEVRRLLAEEAIGDLHAVQVFFSYFNVNPDDIRNIARFGGGALMDIGCYAVNAIRMLFGNEPTRVTGAIKRDLGFGTDVMTSALLEFGERQATLTCSTQLETDQRVHIHGTTGRILVEIPFNIPSDRATRILVASGGEPPVAPDIVVHEVAAADQYEVQADAFSRSLREGTAVPTPPTDAIANLEVMERIVADAERSG